MHQRPIFQILISGSERQYKAQIDKWNFNRNVKQHESRYIVKKVKHRKQAMSKDTGYIRVRGHRIEKERLNRWMREQNDSVLENIVPRDSSHFIFLVAYLMLIISRNTIWNQHPHCFQSKISFATFVSPFTATWSLFSLFRPEESYLFFVDEAFSSCLWNPKIHIWRWDADST